MVSYRPSKTMDFCERAVPYIKPNLQTDDSEADIHLSDKDSPVLSDLGNGLLVSYLVENESSFSYVQNRHLELEDCSLKTLHKNSLSNLTNAALGKIRLQEFETINALFFDGNFEASLILLDELWDINLEQYAPNGFVVAIPAKDVIAFCDKESDLGIQELIEMNKRVFGTQGDHLISDILYVRESGKWHSYPN